MVIRAGYIIGNVIWLETIDPNSNWLTQKGSLMSDIIASLSWIKLQGWLFSRPTMSRGTQVPCCLLLTSDTSHSWIQKGTWKPNITWWNNISRKRLSVFSFDFFWRQTFPGNQLVDFPSLNHVPNFKQILIQRNVISSYTNHTHPGAGTASPKICGRTGSPEYPNINVLLGRKEEMMQWDPSTV